MWKITWTNFPNNLPTGKKKTYIILSKKKFALNSYILFWFIFFNVKSCIHEIQLRHLINYFHFARYNQISIQSVNWEIDLWFLIFNNFCKMLTRLCQIIQILFQEHISLLKKSFYLSPWKNTLPFRYFFGSILIQDTKKYIRQFNLNLQALSCDFFSKVNNNYEIISCNHLDVIPPLSSFVKLIEKCFQRSLNKQFVYNVVLLFPLQLAKVSRIKVVKTLFQFDRKVELASVRWTLFYFAPRSTSQTSLGGDPRDGAAHLAGGETRSPAGKFFRNTPRARSFQNV